MPLHIPMVQNGPKKMGRGKSQWRARQRRIGRHPVVGGLRPAHGAHGTTAFATTGGQRHLGRVDDENGHFWGWVCSTLFGVWGFLVNGLKSPFKDEFWVFEMMFEVTFWGGFLISFIDQLILMVAFQLCIQLLRVRVMQWGKTNAENKKR